MRTDEGCRTMWFVFVNFLCGCMCMHVYMCGHMWVPVHKEARRDNLGLPFLRCCPPCFWDRVSPWLRTCQVGCTGCSVSSQGPPVSDSTVLAFKWVPPHSAIVLNVCSGCSGDGLTQVACFQGEHFTYWAVGWVLFLFCFCFGDRVLVLLCCPGWSWTCDFFFFFWHRFPCSKITMLGLLLSTYILLIIHAFHCQQSYRCTFPKLFIIGKYMASDWWIPHPMTWKSGHPAIFYFLLGNLHMCGKFQNFAAKSLFLQMSWLLESYLVLRDLVHGT